MSTRRRAVSFDRESGVGGGEAAAKAPQSAAGQAAPAIPAHHQRYATIALVLQGGGALGSYQGGVFEGLAEAGIEPNWIAGISIGALNAAVIAGNAPTRRVERLHAFWEHICRQPWWPPMLHDRVQFGELPSAVRQWIAQVDASRALLEGQNGFFVPRWPVPFGRSAEGPGSASYYDTRPLKATLEQFVDFDRINHRPTELRVSVGAVQVRTGNFRYFDNTRHQLGPEHFMASGALPPGFPAVEVDGEFYWDGGLVSNTPLFYVLRDEPRRDTLAFQVDLWSARGDLPQTLGEVAERQKDIQYSSRTRMITEYMHDQQIYRKQLSELLALIPPAQRKDPAAKRAAAMACDRRCNVVQLIYHDKPYEGDSKDYEFGVMTLRDHWASGLADMRGTLAHPEWLAMPSESHPFITHDVHRPRSHEASTAEPSTSASQPKG